MHLIRVLLLAPFTTALAPSPRLRTAFARRDEDLTCPATDYSSCGPDLPGNFCCKKDDTCLVLAGKTTALCCPSDDCPRLASIPCDVSVQDVSQNPTADIMTTALEAALPECGEDLCCPFGYSCNKCNVDGKQVDCCLKDDDQEKKPKARSSTKTSSTKASSTKASSTRTSSTKTSSTETSSTETSSTETSSTETASSTTTDSPTSTITDTPATPTADDGQQQGGGESQDKDKGQRRGIKAVLVGGIFISIFGLALLGFGLVWWLHRKGFHHILTFGIFSRFRTAKQEDGPAKNYYPQQHTVGMDQIPGGLGESRRASSLHTPTSAGRENPFAERGRTNRGTNRTDAMDYDGCHDDEYHDDEGADGDDGNDPRHSRRAYQAQAVQYERSESVGTRRLPGVTHIPGRPNGPHGSQSSRIPLRSQGSQRALSRYGPGRSHSVNGNAWGSEWARTSASGISPPGLVVTAAGPPSLASPLYRNPPSQPTSPFGNSAFGGPSVQDTVENGVTTGSGWPPAQQSQQQHQPSPPPWKQFIPYRKGSLPG